MQVFDQFNSIQLVVAGLVTVIIIIVFYRIFRKKEKPVDLFDRLHSRTVTKTSSNKEPVFHSYKHKQDHFKAVRRKERREQKEREKNIAPVPKTSRECPVCQRPMRIPRGTIMHCHGACKPKYRRATRKIKKQ